MSLVAVGILFFETKNYLLPPEFEKSAELMEEAIEIVSSYCTDNNINTDRIIDPYNTGLIGPEISDITTTLGHLEAKRSTINPNYASLIVKFFKDADIKKGDTIAIGSSGSFPALLIASISAAKAMKLHPLIIPAIGSSSFGANNPDFNILDIYQLLYNKGFISIKPVAVSLGGENDIGLEFDQEIINNLISQIKEFEVPLIKEKDLLRNIRIREKFYELHSSNIKLFINSGGAYSNMGTSQLSLNLKPGLIRSSKLPDQNERGMIFSMLSKNIPVIHLLFIKGLTQQYNLLWDAPSIPAYVRSNYKTSDKHPLLIILGISFLIYFIIILIWFKKYYTS